jgi:predicted phage tail protein
MMRKVYLDGEMARKFGSEFTIKATSMAEVFRCLECNFPEMRQYLIQCHENSIGFLCKEGDKGLQDEEELLLSLAEGDIYISPQPAGSKSGFGKILAAIAIVALVAVGGYLAVGFQAGVTTTGGALAGGLSYAAGTLVGQLAIGLAINLALTGIQQLMAPDPSVDTPDTGEDSYLFRGAEQSILEGDPVPVLYGQLRVPGRSIGFEVRNKENTYTSSNYGGGTYGGRWWENAKEINKVRF